MSRSVAVTVNEKGDLVWSGHDLGPEVAALRAGASEYEFWRYVRAKHVPALLAALGGAAGDDVARLVGRRFRSDVELAEFAAAHDIPTEFSSWTPTHWDDD